MAILGIDFGEKRLGLAISEDRKFAFPLKVILIKKTIEEIIPEIEEICEEKNVKEIVIGLPLTLKGEEGEKAKQVKKFGNLLKEKLNLKIIYEDERLTTKLVEALMHELNISEKKFREKKDMIAAQILLQGYLEKSR